MNRKYFLILLMFIFYLECKKTTTIIEEDPALFNLGDNVYLHQSDMAVEFRVTQIEFDFWNNEKGDIPKLSNLISKKFKDDFDFMIVILNNAEIPKSATYAGLFTSIKNVITGTGGGFYDFSANYGTGKLLKGIINLPAIDFIRNGPLLHELAHYSAAYILPSYNIGKDGKQVNHYDHWGYSDAGGQLGGFKPEFVTSKLDGEVNKYQAGYKSKEDGFGVTSNGRNKIPYSKIELYLLGLIPKTEVPPIKVYSGLSLPIGETRRGVFYATEVKTYTIDDIIAINGERLPSVKDSQKQFKILTVVVSNRPVSPREWEIVNADIEWFTKQSDDGNNDLYNFWEATGGRATIKMSGLKSSLK